MIISILLIKILLKLFLLKHVWKSWKLIMLKVTPCVDVVGTCKYVVLQNRCKLCRGAGLCNVIRRQ